MNGKIEWPTLGIAGLTYGAWAAAVFGLSTFSFQTAIALASVAIALHASLTHEAIHGHPFQSNKMNAALVWPALGLLYPYTRFRDTHLAHHLDCELTDPYDDPETNFLAKADWDRCPTILRALLTWNNTLLGRLTIGPLTGTIFFIRHERRLARNDASVLMAWTAHIPAALFVLALVAASPLPVWAYLIAAYIGNAIIRIRTFLEHRAHEVARGRSVIIEDRGPLALVFLNNNLHAVHHMHPKVPWYALPRLYAEQKERFLSANDNYRYASYWEVFQRYFLTAKDPVDHPILKRD